MANDILAELYQLILKRTVNPIEYSYTCHLFIKGKDEILKKLGEEAVEVIVASKGASRGRVVAELSDLIYHMIVLMVEGGITMEEVFAELRNRMKKSE